MRRKNNFMVSLAQIGARNVKEWTSYLLVCANSSLKNQGWKLMANAKKSDKYISIERFLHIDIEAEMAKIFAIGWSLALLTDLHYEQNHTHAGEGEVKAIIAHKELQEQEHGQPQDT